MTNPLEQISAVLESFATSQEKLFHIVDIVRASQGYVCVPVEVARDAERYRWLSDNCQECPDALGMGGQLYFGTYSGMDGLDFAIDTAMLAASKETNCG